MEILDQNQDLQIFENKNYDLLLEEGLFLADKFINKNYLINLNNNNVIPLEEERKITNHIRLYKITKIVMDPEENLNDKLVSVYNALYSLESTAVLIIDSTSSGIDFYIGIRSEHNAATCGKILEKSIKGNFAGSCIEGLKNSQINNLLKNIVTTEYENTEKKVAALNIIPSLRDDNKEKFVQGMEKFLDTMNGETFTAVIIASPLNKEVLERRKRGLEELYSTLSTFSRTSLSYGVNNSKAVTEGVFENFSTSISNSISNSNSHSIGESTSFSFSISRGYNQSRTVGKTTGQNTSESRNRGTDSPYSESRGSSTSESDSRTFGKSTTITGGVTRGYSSSQSWSRSVTSGSAETTGRGSSKSETATIGDSRNLTINYDNKVVQNLMKKIDEHLERIRMCEAFGLWECAAYFISQDIQTAVVAANTYKALMAGDGSSVENSVVNIWGIKEEENTRRVLEYINYCIHPRIEIQSYFQIEEQFVTPTSLISGNELPLIMGLPKKSVTGINVIEIAEFGRNVFYSGQEVGNRKIKIGNIMHMGMTERNEVYLDLDSFTSHCFITGSTGSGKSNTTYKLIEEFIKNKINFLVIEPAKGEYKKVFGKVKDINIFGTNPKQGRMLRLNPFSFNENIHVLEHVDRLIEIFNACWPMYAAMPAILKSAIERAYIKCGWDLSLSIHIDVGKNKYPTFKDVLEVLPNIINESSYSSDTKGDYIGALVTRISSLTNGIIGQIFCGDFDVEDKVLFDENTIIDLSRIGSTETKALIMGILIMKLNEYRYATSVEENAPLKHITIIEEAHNLLKRTSTEQSQEGANLQGKSVEMISSSIAEMRTFGEGFIIIDQSPTAVDVSAIKNTNTKIIMRLPDQNDCIAVGKAAALNESQIKEIAKLNTGSAIIVQNNWLEPVMAKIDKYNNIYYLNDIANNDNLRGLKGFLVKELFYQYKSKKYDISKIIEGIESFNLSENKRNDFIYKVYSIYEKLQQNNGFKNFVQAIAYIADCRNIFDILPIELSDQLIKVNDNISNGDMELIQKWYRNFYNALDNYIELDDKAIKDYLAECLIYNQAIESRDSRYLLIQDIIFD